MFCIKMEHKSRCDTFFVNILQKHYSFYFGYSGHVWPLPTKTIMPTSKNSDVYLHAKTWTLSVTFLGNIVKILQACYFEQFENVWSCPSIMIVLPCRKQKYWNELVGNFDVYLHAKNQIYLTYFLKY